MSSSDFVTTPIPCTASAVKQIIDSATTADLREGDVWYIVESSWWEIWTNATGYASLPGVQCFTRSCSTVQHLEIIILHVLMSQC